MAHPQIQILEFVQDVVILKDFSGLRLPDLASSFRSNGLYFFSHGLLFVMPELAIMEVIKFKDTAVNSSLTKGKRQPASLTRNWKAKLNEVRDRKQPQSFSYDHCTSVSSAALPQQCRLRKSGQQVLKRRVAWSDTKTGRESKGAEKGEWAVS